MRLACPHCAAAYEVPPALLGRRRRLRCARCGRDWVAQGEPAPADAGEAVRTEAVSAREAPEPRAVAPTVTASAPRRAPWSTATALRLAWAASLLVLAIGAWEAVAWRSSVMRAWPPSQRLYATLGLRRQDAPDRPDTRPSRHARERAGALERGGS